MNRPQPRDTEQWTPETALLELLDLCAVTDRQRPAYRYLSTERIRAVLTQGQATT